MSAAVAENGAHVIDAEFAKEVYENGCPYEECQGAGCCLFELHQYREGAFTDREAAEIFMGGRV